MYGGIRRASLTSDGTLDQPLRFEIRHRLLECRGRSQCEINRSFTKFWRNGPTLT